MSPPDWENPDERQRLSTDAVTGALRNQAMQLELRDLRQHVSALEEQMQEMRAERESLMRYGLMTLGAAVVGMGVYIWQLLADGRLK